MPACNPPRPVDGILLRITKLLDYVTSMKQSNGRSGMEHPAANCDGLTDMNVDDRPLGRTNKLSRDLIVVPSGAIFPMAANVRSGIGR